MTKDSATRDALAAATATAVQVDARLEQTTKDHAPRLDALLAHTDAAAKPVVLNLLSHTKHMHAVVNDTADMARLISKKVRLLDKEQKRVRALLALIDDLSEVRDSAAQVQLAIDKEDWELAAIHVQRFLKHDVDRIRSPVDSTKRKLSTDPSTSIIDSDPILDPTLNNSDQSDLFCPPGSPDPIDTLLDAKKTLLKTITSEFDAAVAASDQESVVRFFKLFAVVGERAMGLDKFAVVLAQVVRRLGQDLMRAVSEAERVPTLYADILTRLYESVASLIDQQEMIVERHYGPGRLLRVIAKLQKEVDVRTSIVIESFEDKRDISRKIADINALDVAASQNKPAPPAAVLLDPREVDALVNEIAIISQRTRLFVRFLEVRAKGEEEKLASLDEEDEGSKPTSSATNVGEGGVVRRRPAELEGIALNKQSGLSLRVKELMSNFATLQEFFLKKSIEKAIKLDEHEAGSQTSSSVDDVFYIVKTSMSRTLSTADPITICTVLESVGRILETEYVSVFLKRLSAGNMGTLETKEGKIGLLILLNNLDTSCDYIQKLVKEINSEIERSFSTSLPAEVEQMKTCLGSLTDYGSSFKRTLMIWVENIFNQMVKPKIRPAIVDVCKDVKYVLSEEEYVDADVQDMFMKRFTREFGKIIALFKSTYSPRNHNQNISYFIETILSEWERHIFANLKVNALGALRFDKDLRSVTTYLTGLTNWNIRDKFVRLNNIGSLLNVEGLGEVAEVIGVSAGWRLSAADVKKVLVLRIDFNAGDVAQLKL
ncbi:UNVERIFIED_CONTAM: Golgi transport complex subunit 4 [Siphonaria sp. JEL0065]|nr:Golgi transport complex subunit 4 [Siphonaria sp. JEL0065]